MSGIDPECARELCADADNPDGEAIMRYFKGVCEAASGCLFETAQREVGTIFGDFGRGKHYVRLVKDAVDAYWPPCRMQSGIDES